MVKVRLQRPRIDVQPRRDLYTMPDGSTTISQLKTGDALVRPPATHPDEALDYVEAILIEIKRKVESGRTAGIDPTRGRALRRAHCAIVNDRLWPFSVKP
jgi:hypothetical protein